MTGDPAARRILMIVGSHAADPVHTATVQGVRRRVDFAVMADLLGDDAAILDLSDVEASPVGRLLSRWGRRQGTYVALALLAFRRRDSVAAFLAGSENEGIVLAALLKLTRRRTPLVIIGIHPAKPAKWAAWRLLRVQTHIDRLMPIVRSQADRLIELGVPASRIEPTPFGVDVDFFDPALAVPARRERCYVLAAGLQHRDYALLVSACDGLDVDLVIAAGSLYATTGAGLDPATLPSWVTVTTLGYAELRDAYAGAAVVAVPTVEAPFAPGMTSLLEAMAMARPVVGTRSAGNDYVVDRRAVLRRDATRATATGFSIQFASPGNQGQTGYCVAPGDAPDLRRVLSFVLDHPELAAEVGARARRVAREVYSVDAYSARVVAAVRSAVAAGHAP